MRSSRGGIRPGGGSVSGNASTTPTAQLHGPMLAAIVAAIPVTARNTGRPVIVVGGLAVLCRLSRPYRATTDLDTVSRLQTGQVGQLELLLAAGATPSGPTGVQVQTPLGPVQVDVLEVTDADLAPLPDDPTDRLHVLSHAWAAQTATPVHLAADNAAPVTVLVARPPPLVAMKRQSVMNRGSAKEGTDLLDIVRLTTDPATAASVIDGLRTADDQLTADALLHARRWFHDSADRTLQRIRAIPEGASTTAEDLALVAELLGAALRPGEAPIDDQLAAD